jgi:hypothetical protein
MHPKGRDDGIDFAISALARRQHGVVTRAQLIDAGCTPDGVKHRVSNGRLHPLYRGVYAVGHTKLTEDASFIAAVLACGEGAVLSHRSAIEHWKMRGKNGGPVHVTVPGGGKPRHGIEIHRGTPEATSLRGIPVSTVPRTILDFARVAKPEEVALAINEAKLRNLAKHGQIARLPQTHAHYPGIAAVKAALGDSPTRFTRSGLERRFLRFCSSHGIPLPDCNVPLMFDGRPIEADCVWPQHKLIVELDDRATHSSPASFDNDRARDRALAVEEWRPLRVTPAHLDERTQLAADLKRLLGTAASTATQSGRTSRG